MQICAVQLAKFAIMALGRVGIVFVEVAISLPVPFAQHAQVGTTNLLLAMRALVRQCLLVNTQPMEMALLLMKLP